MPNQDRTRLAKAMGWRWEPCASPLDHIKGWQGGKWSDPNADDDLPDELKGIVGCKVPPPLDPFTDANDDYAVLEHFRHKQKAGGGNYKADLANWIEWTYSVDYKIGDYARAALKVIERV